ncbi:MAG: cysteine desulfurase family protein [Gammaproteobacteria bacterium]|jgi:cysteine desulfurase|nr:IscS subfamily cysteine desulfurase [Gammaproteobacteria bacterium]MBQ08746.1 IscS subfamily cysteine desulfurase [Gammaproteobacteria bacterium]MDP6147332.1 cysteine desulfurase family protein [Gammaproteobacteria bacterium]HJL80155.1 cysteine desulfurase family protein [Gammaproteobacteria bacterium]HJM08567.1 cysteine desulfurase family protein [Gammaproteobacteria bacterium]|tara:strand:+ start:36578 stop:37738 length:1161 start_codon:yes stop_codon:yes gene_type:complete
MKTYLDFASTTPMAPEVIEEMHAVMSEDSFGNPSSLDHQFGISANNIVEQSRNEVANLINANPEEILWTSGATESNNLAIVGFHQFQYKGHPLRFTTSHLEHKSVIESMRSIEELESKVSFIQPNKDGQIDLETFTSQLNPDAIFASCMHINNETGVVNEIKEIGKYCKKNEIIFHVDAAQSIGKIPIDVKEMCIDLMSMSAHKVYGPKGVGALYINKDSVGRVKSLIVGGGQERGMRSGTLPTHQIAGMASAYRVSKQRMHDDLEHIQQCRDAFLKKLSSLNGWKINGSVEDAFPGILSLCFHDLYSESLIYAMEGFAISRGSACSSDHDEPSHVLKSMGLLDHEINGTIRISFGRTTSLHDTESAASELIAAVTHLRNLKGDSQ